MRHDGSNHHDGSLPAEHAELVALADGSLAPQWAAVLEARAAASPRLAVPLAEQRRAVRLVRSAVAETWAPEALRERLRS
jgi:anti-sigma factor RsiW